MTATVLTQTLYAPNPPQIDEPWLKALFVTAFAIIAALIAGS